MSPFSEHKDRAEVLDAGEGTGTELSDIAERIGRIIRSARLCREVTQEALGVAVHRSRTTIVNIEAGAQGIPLPLLYDIAFALDVSVHDLLPDEPTNSTVAEDLAKCSEQLRDLTRRFDNARRLFDA